MNFLRILKSCLLPLAVFLIAFVVAAPSVFASTETFTCSAESSNIGRIEVSDLAMANSKNYQNDFINLQLAVGEQILVLNKSEVSILENGKYGRIYLGSKNSYSVSFTINEKKTAAELSLSFEKHELVTRVKLACEKSK